MIIVVFFKLFSCIIVKSLFELYFVLWNSKPVAFGEKDLNFVKGPCNMVGQNLNYFSYWLKYLDL